VMNDEAFMRRALDEAAAASEHGEVPIGAVLVKEDVVVAAAGNERQLRQDPTAHAEILVLRAGADKLGTWRLEETTLYVTLEPCPMCAGALVLARVKRLVYGSQDPKAGAALSLYNIVQDPRLNHEVEITPGVLGEETAAILQSFFQGKRAGPTL
jgi:tRNA(adenine34) deaminase